MVILYIKCCFMVAFSLSRLCPNNGFPSSRGKFVPSSGGWDSVNFEPCFLIECVIADGLALWESPANSGSSCSHSSTNTDWKNMPTTSAASLSVFNGSGPGWATNVYRRVLAAFWIFRRKHLYWTWKCVDSRSCYFTFYNFSIDFHVKISKWNQIFKFCQIKNKVIAYISRWLWYFVSSLVEICWKLLKE